MANRVCWKCGVNSHMTQLIPGYSIPTFGAAGDHLVTAAFKCDECQWISVGWVRASQGALDGPDVSWAPSLIAGKDFPDVPEHIRAAADEAYRCRSIDAYRGATILARAVIEATCKDKGAQGKNLAARIDALRDDEHVRPHTAQVAHEVRHLGNDMAHGDFVEDIESEEADEILQLMDEVLDEVYGSPARLARRQAARETKKAGTS